MSSSNNTSISAQCSKMWTPTSMDGLQGWVSTHEQVMPVKKAFEVSSSVSFLCEEKKHYPNEPCAKKRIRFHDIRQNVIPQDGVPFMTIRHIRYGCMYGRNKNASKEKREEENRLKGLEPIRKKHRKRRGVEKKGCPAFINVKEVIRFTDFKDCNSVWRQKMVSKEIRRTLDNGGEFNIERKIFIRFPTIEDHQEKHHVDQVSLSALTSALSAALAAPPKSSSSSPPSSSPSSTSVPDTNENQQHTQMDPEFQAKHRKEILKTLNEGSMKQIKSLPSVGEKRAQLIHNWRQAFGVYTQIEDLYKVMGLPSKAVDNIIKTNLLST